MSEPDGCIWCRTGNGFENERAAGKQHMFDKSLTMNKYRIACLVLFFLFYVVWLFKGDEWIGGVTEPAVTAGQSVVAAGETEREAGIRFAWLLGY